jgi:hypothetical protein
MKKDLFLNGFEAVDGTLEQNGASGFYFTTSGCQRTGKLITKGPAGRIFGDETQKAQYIVLDVVNCEPWTLAFVFEFWKESNAGDTADLIIELGVFPGLKTRLAVPLEALNSEKLFIPRTPGRMQGFVFGSKVDINEVTRFAIGVKKNGNAQTVGIIDVYLSDVEPDCPVPDGILVDELGQLIARDWAGKTRSPDDLIEYLQHELSKEEDFGTYNAFSEYGGWKEKRFQDTGYFRREYHEGRWWLVDPDGYAFFSIGIDIVTLACLGEVDWVKDIEKLFQWLPPKEGEFAEAWVKGKNMESFNCEGIDFYSFKISNLIRAFGKDWWRSWAKITRRRLREWGFNTIGGFSSVEFARYAKMPYTLALDNFPGTTHCIYRDFPDVFSEEYRIHSELYAEQLREFIDDRYMIGYFMRNEPQWAFVAELNLVEAMLEKEFEFDSKKAFIQFIIEKYHANIEDFNQAWNLSLDSFDQLKQPLKKASGLSMAAARDSEEFSRKMIHKYIQVPSEAIRNIDAHHLNFGMRYAFITPNKAQLSGADCYDVFSINCYKKNPLDYIHNVTCKVDMPILIGEFHFGAPDVGLTDFGLGRVNSQKDRGLAYRYYVENGAADKNCVGIHYFEYYDQAALGRRDGENYQIGCVDICQRPYEDFIREVTATNLCMYEVVGGKRAACTIMPEVFLKVEI